MKLGLPAWLRRGTKPPAEPEPAPSAAAAPAAAGRGRRRLIAVATGLVLAMAWAWCFYWSREPAPLWVVAETPAGERTVVGYSTVHTLSDVIDWLLEKPGGYLSND